MEDKQVLIDIAIALQKLIAIQASEMRAMDGLVESLTDSYPQLSSLVDAARERNVQAPPLLREVKKKLDEIVLSLSE